MNVLDLARPELRQRVAYQTGNSSRDYIRLHANETPRSMGNNTYNRYPKARPLELTNRLADLYRVNTSQLLPTRGSDDGIDLLIRGFCQASRDSILICPPTFGMYKSFAEIQDASVFSVPLKTEDYQLDLSALVDTPEKPKLIFLCSPNNPTGNVVPKDHIAYLCDVFNGISLIVVDEAYIEFANSGSCTDLLNKYSNLVILRTLSKAYGLAALRCGAIIATPQIIALLQSIMAPYAIPTPCIDATLETLKTDVSDQLQARIADIRNEKKRVETRLERHHGVIKVWPSETNFLLVKFKDAASVYQDFLDKGVMIRNFSEEPGLDGCLRITIGETAENDSVLSILGTS